MHRLFVAIDLPERVRDDIVAMVDRHLTAARWVPREQLHLTLRFIGDADDMMLRTIKGGLDRLRGGTFPLSLKGVGHFPPRGEPRVIWVGVEDSEELNSLQRAIEGEMVKAGVEADRRRFSPHITIARLRDCPTAQIARLEGKHRQFSAGPFPVEEFYLYSSILNRDGAIHRREAAYRLEPVSR